MDNKVIWKGVRTFRGDGVILEVEAELKASDSYDWENPESKKAFTELTISGSIWEGETKSEENISSAGQCLDSINLDAFKEKAEIMVIKDIWKHWHLNCMLPGSKAQEKALRMFYKINPGIKKDYDVAVKYLKTINLHVDNGFSYGSNYLGKELPEAIITEVKKLIPERED